MNRFPVTSRADARRAVLEFRNAGSSAALVTNGSGRIVGHLFGTGFSSSLVTREDIAVKVRRQAGSMVVGDAYKAMTRIERREILTNLRSFRLTGRAGQ